MLLPVTLTLTSIELTRYCRERNLYVVLAVTQVDTPDRLTVTRFADTDLLVPGYCRTHYSYAPTGNAGIGLCLLSTPMPADKILYVRLWVMASVDGRKSLREVLAEVNAPIDDPTECALPGSGTPRSLVVRGFKTPGEALDKLGIALVQSGDRQLGYVSMDQTFKGVTLPIRRAQAMLSGEGTLRWHWAVGAPPPPMPLRMAMGNQPSQYLLFR